MAAQINGDLLIVCSANVCRSPLAEFLLGRGLPEASVRSAGVIARPGDPVCDATKELLIAKAGGAEFAEAHAAARVDEEQIAVADLILTASEVERSAIAVLAPEVRVKAFTLVEAAHSAASIERLPTDVTLSELAALINARRGLVDLPVARRRRIFRSSHGIAIPDAHIGDARQHAEVYRAVFDAVEMFTRAVGRVEPRTRRRP